MTQNLRTPGPTPLPDDVLDAQSRPMIDHRGTEFAEMLGAISSGIGQLIGTSGDVLLLTGSGSVAMEVMSGLGGSPFELEAWGVELVVSASQKAWMGSPGIGIAAVGERAWAANDRADMPRFYWDLREARSFADKGQTPWTPAVSV